MREVMFVAQKEMLDNVRNKWMIFSSILLILLILVFFFFNPSVKESHDFGEIAFQISGATKLMIPIIALILGYASISREIERGTMESLLSMPISRRGIVTGKFLGLATILIISILVSFFISAIIILSTKPMENHLYFLNFTAYTIIFGISFLSLSFFLSSLFKKRSTSLIVAIFVWFFFNLIMPMIQMGLLIAEMGLKGALAERLPGWFYAVNLLNPISAYGSLIEITAGSSAYNLPYFYTPFSIIAVFTAWILIFFLSTLLRFKRIDV